MVRSEMMFIKRHISTHYRRNTAILGALPDDAGQFRFAIKRKLYAIFMY